jgi:hypothetical protein
VERKRLFGSFEVKVFAKLLKAKVGGILIMHVLLDKRLIGNREREFTILSILAEHQAEVVPASWLQLKSQVLNLRRCLYHSSKTSTRVNAKGGRGCEVVEALEPHHLFRLQALGAFGDHELHRLAFGE